MVYRTAHRRLDYDYAIRPMMAVDLGQAHQLSIGVGWPPRPEDWRRALGSAMWWPFGEDFAAVGMVITSPRLQAQGAGGQLMDAIFSQAGRRDLRLNATKAGYRLYRSLAFEPVGRIFQHPGLVRPIEPVPDADRAMRAATSGDLDALSDLDARAYGADRRRVMAALLAQSSGTVMERDGRPVGFALCRRFGRGHVVGSIVAGRRHGDRADAAHVAAHEGGFLRVDTAQEQGVFGAFLEAGGLTIFDSVTTMIRGRGHGTTGDARTF